ncbi:tetratricopeptide repeat protein, partial [Gemmatimonadota bacterium]
MNGRLRLGLLAFVAAALAAFPLQSETVSAQEASARWRVMVPDAQALQGANRRFGERLADQLRDLINDMITHQPVEEGEIKDALKRFDRDMEDMDCILTRQLGQQIQAELVFCGSYAPEGEGFRVEGSFVGANGEAFEVDPISVGERGQREAAEHFFQALESMVQQLRYAQFCGDYASSQQWDDALTNCDRAIEINPGTVGSRYTRAMVLRETDQIEDALDEFKRVLELDPLHEDAMQNAGYCSALLGNDEDARSYYSGYLQLNPANAAVRMRVAYDLATAGDPLGAMQLIEEGLELEPENLDLLKQHAGFALAAGSELSGGQEEMPPEATELYRKALTSYTTVYGIEGAEMQVGQLTSMIQAHLSLEEHQEAVDLAGRVLETHAEEAAVWSVYANALQRSGSVDEAIEALERVKEIDPDYANVTARQGNWLMAEGRLDEAMPVFQEAITRGEQSADAVANMIFGNGYRQGVDNRNWDYAVRVMGLAGEFDVSPEMRQQLDFWLAYSIYQRAQVQQQPNTLETAQATLPQFQRVLRLLNTCAGYAQRNNLENNRQ